MASGVAECTLKLLAKVEVQKTPTATNVPQTALAVPPFSGNKPTALETIFGSIIAEK